MAASTRGGLLRVRRFWEKPSLRVAFDLLERGCVWNTCVMVGSANAFVTIIRSIAPGFCNHFGSLWEAGRSTAEASVVSGIYKHLAAADFSQHVLARLPESLGIFCFGDVEWSDLGDARRIMDVLAQTGAESDNRRIPPWQAGAVNVPADGTGDSWDTKGTGASAS